MPPATCGRPGGGCHLALALPHSTQASLWFLLMGIWDPARARAVGCPFMGETLFPGRRCVTAWGFQVCSARRQWGSGTRLCPEGMAAAWVLSWQSPAGSTWNLVNRASCHLLVNFCSFHDKLLGDKKAGCWQKGFSKEAKGTVLSCICPAGWAGVCGDSTSAPARGPPVVLKT